MSDLKQKEQQGRTTQTIGNPVTDRNSGQIWPIFVAIVFGSFAWFLYDPDLRKALGEVTGLRALEPIVPEIRHSEYEIKVWGNWASTCFQRVAVVAKEKELELDVQFVDTAAKQQKTPEHLAKQPFGQVPVLEIEEDEYLFESRAIAKYLVNRYHSRGTPLTVHGLIGNAYAEQAYSIETSNFDPYASKLSYELGMKRQRLGLPPDEAAVALALTTLSSKLDAYEVILGKQDFLAGHNLTLADLFHLPYGQKLIDVGHPELLTDEKTRPNVARWWKSISERPSWKNVRLDVETWQKQQEEERREAEETRKEQTE